MIFIKINLKKKPENPTIIVGFPGFGLIGPITTEFLMNHLDVETIGGFEFEELSPTVAVHEGELINPMSLNYCEENNLIIIHTILSVKGHGWKVADEVIDLLDELNGEEIISLEGVNSFSSEEDLETFYFNNFEEEKSFETEDVEQLEESVVMGPSAALLLKCSKVSCFFAETHTKLPDSKASASVVKALDQYLGLDIDYSPLLEQAEEFEKKLKSLIEQSKKAKQAKQEADEKQMSYLG